MSSKTLKVVLKNAIKTEAQWISSDPVIGEGVCVYSSDKGNMYKIGDGVKTWSQLDYNFIELIKMLYPVGHILITTDSTNPGTLYPGTTWESWGSGRMPLGIDSSNESYNAPGITGGSYDTTLAVANLPSHTHSIDDHKHSLTITKHSHSVSITTSKDGTHDHRTTRISGMYAEGAKSGGPVSWDNNNNLIAATNVDTSDSGAHTHKVSGDTGEAKDTITMANTSLTAKSTGSGTAFSNMPPYITCYMWRRTA